MLSKECTKCKVEKDLTEFNRASQHKDGLKSECRACELLYRQAHREERCAKARLHYQANKEKYAAYGKMQRERENDKMKIASRAKHLLVSYGLTVEQHKQMYIDQNGCCLLCDKPVEYDKIHTDHNHVTNKVRGLLCCRCNLGMCFIDDINFMERAIEYGK